MFNKPDLPLLDGNSGCVSVLYWSLSVERPLDLWSGENSPWWMEVFSCEEVSEPFNLWCPDCALFLCVLGVEVTQGKGLDTVLVRVWEPV